MPATANDLPKHVCLRQKYSSGQIAPFPASLVTSVIDPLLGLTLAGAGIACFPDFLVKDALANGSLLAVLDGEIEQTGVLTMLWPLEHAFGCPRSEPLLTPWRATWGELSF
jgi:DNA-binding transcriptional LysR family regulator